MVYVHSNGLRAFHNKGRTDVHNASQRLDRFVVCHEDLFSTRRRLLASIGKPFEGTYTVGCTVSIFQSVSWVLIGSTQYKTNHTTHFAIDICSDQHLQVDWRVVCPVRVAS